MTITLELNDEEAAQLVIDAFLIARHNYPFDFFKNQLLREWIEEIHDKGEKEGWELDKDWVDEADDSD